MKIFFLNLKRYIVTLYYLRFSQILWRVIYKFYKPSPSFNNKLLIRKILLKNYIFLNKRSSYIERGSFNFLNKIIDVNFDNWRLEGASDLWEYNLHYFDFVNSDLNDQKKVDISLSWIKNYR